MKRAIRQFPPPVRPAPTAGFLVPALVTALVLAAGPGSASAGVGSAVGPAATVDTAAPRVTLVLDPVGDLFQGGALFQALVTTEDDHPGPGPGDHFVVAFAGTTGLDTLLFDPAPPSDSVAWQAPEISSAQVRLVAHSRDAFGNMGTASSETFTVIPSVTAVPGPGGIPVFGPPRPNPFNPSVSFALDLPAAGRLTVRVFDPRGRRVRDLVARTVPAGPRAVTWDGTDRDGRRLPAGVYLVEMDFQWDEGAFRRVSKVVLLP